MIVLIDNYDSFTFNLFHYLGGLGADVVVHRNDKISADAVIAAEPEAIVLSPGPLHAERSRHLPRPDRQGRSRRSRSSASASAIRRSAKPSAARWCARRRRTARCSRSGTAAPACFAASTGRSAPRAIIRWWSSAPPCRASLTVNARNQRRSGHGTGACEPAGARRAVPSREHRLRARPSDAEEFSRSRRRLEHAARPHRERCGAQVTARFAAG